MFANTDWYLYNFRLGLAKFLRANGFEVVMMSPNGPYVARLSAEGFRWIGLDLRRRSLNPFREVLLIWQLAKILRREAPNLVHNFTIKCVIYGSIAATWARVSSQVNAIAGLGTVFVATSFRDRPLRWIVILLLRIALARKSTRLVVQNRSDRETLLAIGVVCPDKVRLIKGSGVNTSRFSPRIRHAAGTMRVLLASRLLWDKGLREFLTAADQFGKSDLDIEFLLAGDIDPGNPGSATSEDVRSWRKSGVVNILGQVEDVAALLSNVDLMVLPTVYGEGVPRCLIEAAASGLPIIATDVPGCREIVEHGVNGYLIAVRDPSALVDAIRLLYENPSLRHNMGRAGRAKAVGEFDEKIVFEKTLAVYRETLPS